MFSFIFSEDRVIKKYFVILSIKIPLATECVNTVNTVYWADGFSVNGYNASALCNLNASTNNIDERNAQRVCKHKNVKTSIIFVIGL